MKSIRVVQIIWIVFCIGIILNLLAASYIAPNAVLTIGPYGRFNIHRMIVYASFFAVGITSIALMYYHDPFED